MIKKYSSFNFILITSLTLLSSCSKNLLEEIPFNIDITKIVEVHNVNLIKNVAEFNSFLNNQDIFTNNPSKEFQEINKNFDLEYFNNNYLAAIIIWANSPTIYGYELKNITFNNNIYEISLKYYDSNKSDISIDVMGKVFCYYIDLDIYKDAKDCLITYI